MIWACNEKRENEISKSNYKNVHRFQEKEKEEDQKRYG